LQATFEERVREPISPFILIAIFIGPVIFLISKLIKFINKKLSRRRRLKYAVKKYKKMKRKDKKKINKKNKA
jgi:predicted RND superfamily exporter protein